MPRTYAAKARRFYTAGSDHPDLQATPVDPPVEWLRTHVRARKLVPDSIPASVRELPLRTPWEPCARCGAARTREDRRMHPDADPTCGSCDAAARAALLRQGVLAGKLEKQAVSRGVLLLGRPVYSTVVEEVRPYRHARRRVREIVGQCPECGNEPTMNAHLWMAGRETLVFHSSCWGRVRVRFPYLTMWALGRVVDTELDLPEPDVCEMMLQEEAQRRRAQRA